MVEGIIDPEKEKTKKFEFKPKHKPKFKFTSGKVIFVVLVLAGIALLIAVVEESKMKFDEGECSENLYLGHCFNVENEYFTCNIEGEECPSKTWDIVMKIRIFEEYGIVIYGQSGCSACIKQLEEFGVYADIVKEKGIYVDCSAESGRYDCQDVRVTPTWKEKGTIVQEGYVPLSQILVRQVGE